LATPTPYTEIYSVFQSQFSDPAFNGLSIRDDLSKVYLINSIPKFRRCLQNLDNRDDVNANFNIVLTDDEKQILGNLMVLEYLSPQIVSSQLIDQVINNRDMQISSQANHLEKLLLLHEQRSKKVSKMIIDYTYTFSDLTKLK
jgi:hypothetical protein